jgi:(heptosyl)LPS beta-1,4-glucosyltransferase
LSRPTLAVALIVKNEEKYLRQCLESVQGWVDEIVILDSGSTDATEEIAREFTSKFYVNCDWPGFGPQRRIAQSYVVSDYLLWLDADEIVTPELRSSIVAAVEADKPGAAYKINRLSRVLGKFIHHSGWSPDWVVRLYRTTELQYNDNLVHEAVDVTGRTRVIGLSGRLKHYTFDDYHQFQSKQNDYAKLWAENRWNKGKRATLSTAVVHSLFAFFRMMVIQRGLLDGKHGLMIATVHAQYVFNKYCQLYLLNSKNQYSE